MEQNLLVDLQKLTNIQQKIFNKLISISNLCICDYVNELDMTDKDVLKINIGIGTISLLVCDDEVTYTFTPSKELETNIITVFEEKYNPNPLINGLELKLDNKIISTYKEFI